MARRVLIWFFLVVILSSDITNAEIGASTLLKIRGLNA